MNALIEPGAAEFANRFNLKPLAKMIRSATQDFDLSGKALFDVVTTKQSKVDDEICFPSNAGGCFAKGTRVHAKDGLKPIEDIKVGDYVLSSPEDGSGRQEYRRVLKTFVHEQKVIVEVQFTNFDATSVLQGGDIYFVTATENHPFWVEGVGWTRADALKGGDFVRKADGSLANVFGLNRIYRTSREGVGWTFIGADIKSEKRSLFWHQLGYETYEEYFFAEEIGSLFDYANYDLAEDDGRDKYISSEVYHSENPYLKVRVYNLEVEDFHTYYVGAQGFWVHNTNCEGVGLSKGREELPIGSTPLYGGIPTQAMR